MSYQVYYKKGDHAAICDRCGWKYKASMLKKEWNGLRVCRDCFEPRHEQDFLRGKKDDQSVEWTRSEPTDTEAKVCQTRSAVAGIAEAGCMIAGNDDRNSIIPQSTYTGGL